MYLDSPPDTAGTYQGVSLKIPATLLQLTAEQFAARSGRERIAGACGGQFLRHRRRRKGALLRSRTTIRLREVPEGFDGLWHLFHVRQLPRLIEQRFRRPVEAEPWPPSLPGRRVNPVHFLSGRSFRANVKVH